MPSLEKSNVEIAFELALQLIFSKFSRTSLELSVTQNSLNEK